MSAHAFIQRWQDSGAAGAIQTGLGVEAEEAETAPIRTTRRPWPETLPERVRAVHDYLSSATMPVTAETIARTFVRARSVEVTAILDTLVALGQASLQKTGYGV